MKGNILNKKEYAYYKFLIFPFRAIYYTLITFFVIINGTGLLYSLFLGGIKKVYIDTFLMSMYNTMPLLFYSCIVAPIAFIFLNMIIPLPTKRIKETIRVGTKLYILSSTNYKRYHPTGTRTTYYHNFMPVASYDNYTTSQGSEGRGAIAFVSTVKKRGFEIDLYGKKEFIKFRKLFKKTIGIETVQVEGAKFSDIVSIDIFT